MVFSMKGVQAMTLYTMVMTGLVLVGAASLASANPSMLPKHPGYPSGGEYANDTGQRNLTLEQSLRADSLPLRASPIKWWSTLNRPDDLS